MDIDDFLPPVCLDMTIPAEYTSRHPVYYMEQSSMIKGSILGDRPSVESSDNLYKSMLILMWTLVAAAVIMPFWTANVSSLWVDELFTAHFTDPLQPTVTSMLRRAAEDVHPPGYYLILFLLRKFEPGNIENIGRGFSAACCAVALIVFGLSVRRMVSPFALVVSLLYASLSVGYAYAAQEMRSYGLGILLVSINMALILRLFGTRAGNDDNGESWVWAALYVSLVTGGVIHSYLVLIGLSTCAYMLLCSKTINQQVFSASAALSIIVAALTVLYWQREYIVPNLDKTWFTNDPSAMISYGVNGLKILIGCQIGIVSAILALALNNWNSSLSRLMKSPRSALRHPVSLCLFVIAGSVVLVLCYSLVVRPIFQARVFYLLFPLTWTPVALATDMAEKLRPLIVRTILFIFVLFSATRLLDYLYPTKEEWRLSAHFVDSFATCEKTPIAAVGFDQRYILYPEERVFYGRYLQTSPDRLQLISRALSADEIARRAAKVARSNDATAKSFCPIMLWTVHHIDIRKIEHIVGRLNGPGSLIPDGYTATIVRFTEYPTSGILTPWNFGWTLKRDPEFSKTAYVIILKKREQTDSSAI